METMCITTYVLMTVTTFCLFALPLVPQRRVLWSYTVQVDTLFEGSCAAVDLAPVVQPHTGIQLSFSIDYETSDVETPALYHFHKKLDDSNRRFQLFDQRSLPLNKRNHC